VIADPYRALVEIEAPRVTFTRAVYRQSVIGSIPELEAATAAEVRLFHRLFYRPDNASLVVVGDFDPAALDAWIDRYFGPIVRPAFRIPGANAEEPVRTAHRVVDSYGPDAPQPALLLTFVGPPASSADASALQVLDAVLTLGGTSRLQADLVGGRQVADHVFSEADLWQHAGLIQVGATLADGVTMARGEAALRAEIAKVRGGAVSEADVQAAKNRLLAQRLRDLETIDGVARAIGEAAILQGEAAHANTDLRSLQAVTAADVRRVAKTWLADARRITIRYHAAAAPAPPAAPPHVARGASDRASDAVAVVDDGALPAIPAPPPPAAGQADAPTAPKVSERTLANGLRVIVARTGRQPIATAALSFGGGSAADPPGKAGLAYAAAMLAVGGRDAASGAARAHRIAALGDTLAAEADYDSTGFRLSGLTASLPEGLETLAAIARRPQFDATQLEGLRRRLLDDSQAPGADGDALSEAAINQLAFGGSSYGHLANGDPRPSASITAADVARAAAGLFRPDRAVLVVTGGVDASAVFALAEHAFGDWRAAGPAPPAAAKLGAARAGRVVAIDVPGLEEATVTVAARSIPRTAPSYYAAELANALLGGGEASRLSMEVRVRRGLTYDASSELDEFGQAGLFTATSQTGAAHAPEVATLMMSQLKALAHDGPSSAELAARKADLIGEFYREAATSGGLADLLTDHLLYRVDLGEIGSYAARVGAVRTGEVKAAAAQLADPATADVVIVGDAKAFMPALRARFPHAQVIRPASLRALAALGG
jgi:zinc protease